MHEENFSKMLVVDLDGTLLNTQGKLSQKNADYIKKAINRGTLVCIATGRHFNASKEFALDNKEMPIICSNGALIKDAVKETLYYRKYLNNKDVFKIYNYSAQFKNTLIYLFEDDAMYVNILNKKTLYFGKYFSKSPKLINDINEFSSLKLIKMVIAVEDEENTGLVDNIENWVNNEIENSITQRCDPLAVDIIAANCSKGRGIKILAEKFNIDKKDIISVGNYFNDINMFEESGIGACVGNSPEKVKEKADLVVGSNDEDGVAEVISKVILNKEIA